MRSRPWPRCPRCQIRLEETGSKFWPWRWHFESWAACEAAIEKEQGRLGRMIAHLRPAVEHLQRVTA